MCFKPVLATCTDNPSDVCVCFRSLNNSNTKLSLWSLWPVEFTLWRKYCIFNPCLPPANSCLQPSTRRLMPRVVAMPGSLLLICGIRSTVRPVDLLTKGGHTAAGSPMQCRMSKKWLLKGFKVYKHSVYLLNIENNDWLASLHSTIKLRGICDKQHLCELDFCLKESLFGHYPIAHQALLPEYLILNVLCAHHVKAIPGSTNG